MDKDFHISQGQNFVLICSFNSKLDGTIKFSAAHWSSIIYVT